MKRETLLLLFSRQGDAQKKAFDDRAKLARRGEFILRTFSEQGRIAPYYLPADWDGFGEHISESTDFEGFSFLPSVIDNGIKNANWKNIAIGGGLGGIAGLTYGYWDWQDEKRQAELKGLEKPNKKKILIRDTLIGLGLGATAGAFADKLLKVLEDKKATEEQKLLFDNIEKEILKGQDKRKIRKYLQLHSKDLTKEQYKYLSEFANSMMDRDAIQARRDMMLQVIQDARIADERKYRESQKPSKFEQIKEQILRVKNQNVGEVLIDSATGLTKKQKEKLTNINDVMPSSNGANTGRTSAQTHQPFKQAFKKIPPP